MNECPFPLLSPPVPSHGEEHPHSKSSISKGRSRSTSEFMLTSAIRVTSSRIEGFSNCGPELQQRIREQQHDGGGQQWKRHGVNLPTSREHYNEKQHDSRKHSDRNQLHTRVQWLRRQLREPPRCTATTSTLRQRLQCCRHVA